MQTGQLKPVSLNLGLDVQAVIRIAAALDHTAEEEARRGNMRESAEYRSLADRWCRAFNVQRPGRRVIVAGQ